MKEVDQVMTVMYDLLQREKLTEEELLRKTKMEVGVKCSFIVPQELYNEARAELGCIVGRDENKKLYVL